MTGSVDPDGAVGTRTALKEPPPKRPPHPDPGRERRQFITHNVMAGAGTWVAGVFGLLLQAMVSHHFRPGEYGQAFAVFTFFTVLTQPAAGFSRMIAWSTSRELATRDGNVAESSALLRTTNRRLLVGGSLIALGFIAAAPMVAQFLNIPASFVILGAIGVPFMLSTSPLLASLQGQQKWLPWSFLSIATAAARVVFVAAMVIPFGIDGVVLGISVAAAAVYFIALGMVWPQLRLARGHAGWRPQRNFLIVSVSSTIMVSVLMGSDVLLVEHFFGAREGGQFSAVTVTSRALFFAMGSVTSVLFPKVAARQASSRSTTSVVVASLALGLAGGLVGLLVFSLGSDLILRSFSGKAYVGGDSYIGWYALGMPLLAAVVMLSNSLQSLADLKLLLVLAPGALLKPLLILAFHQSLLVVAVVSDASIGVVFIALALTYLLQERRRLGRRGRAYAGVPVRASAYPSPMGAIAAATALAAAVPVSEEDVMPLRVVHEPSPPPEPPLWLQRLESPSWWHEKSRWLVEHPKRVLVSIAIVGVAVRQAWLSVLPLSAGDWHWPDRQRLLEYFPWPAVWDNSLGLGGENRFVQSFRYPVAFFSGLFASVGASWTVIEKVLYFVPYAVLLPAAGWLLAREIMGRTRWAILTPVILLGSTYFTLESDGEIPLALAEVVSMLALIAFLRTMRRRSLGWAVITGLAVAVTTAFDIRPAYLCVVLMAMYFVLSALLERSWALLRRRLLLGAAAGAVFIGTQAFWLVPLLTYHGNPGFPTPQAPDFNILTLGHGLAGVSAFWSGGTPAQLVQAPLNPAYMILPLLAFMPLLARRVRPEVVWLAVAALLFAFFAKTDTPPLGGLYDWMYLHVPGWKLFREGSKFLYIVTVAYAILIPIGLAAAFEWAKTLPKPSHQGMVRNAAGLAVVGVVALSLSTVGVLESGTLGSTTNPTAEPASFASLSDIISNDARPGPILYLGQPVLSMGTHNHHFLIASSQHPAVNLTGSFSSTKINQRDPFQLYCANNLVPFCYLDPALFPYLMRVTGTAYVVVPGGPNAGALPKGVTRSWLAHQMRSMFGEPTVLGGGDTALLVWRMSNPEPIVTSSPAVALVDSGPWSTTAAMPALEALGVPTAYAQSFDNLHYPVAPSGLPDTVPVIPRTDGGCLAGHGGSVGVMAQSTSPSLDVSVAGSAQTLPIVAVATRLAGWGVYGPISIGAGSTPISAGNATITLGPCIGWSSLAATALGDHPDPVGDVSITANGEQIDAASTGPVGAWVELRRYFDPGWRLDQSKPIGLGDGLFNLYHLGSAPAAGATLDFSFSTALWEHLGQGVAILATGLALLVAVRDLRRRLPGDHADIEPPLLIPSAAARWIGIAGLAVLTVAAAAVTVEWFGVPSALPGVPPASDPYSLEVGYGALAIVILLLSLLVRVVVHIAGSGRASTTGQPVPVPARLGFAAVLMLAVALVVAACGTDTSSPDDIQNLISEAQQAGSVAPTIQGASLDDARLQRSARDAALCIADYSLALQDFPDLATAYAGRGDCYLNGGRNGPAAVHDYSQAISLTPDADQADLYLKRAVADRVSGDLVAAAADYQQAAAIPSANAGQHLTAVDGLVTLGQYDAARTVYRQALARDPQSALLHLAGADIAVATGDDQLTDQELATAAQLVTDKGQTATVLGHLCHIDVLRHDYAKATSDCATSAQLSGNGSASEDDLSAAQLALGDPSAALTAINASIGSFIGNVGPYAQESGVDGFGLANLYSARAWIEVQLHRRSAAIADFRVALQSLPPSTGPDTRARIQAYIATARVD